MLPPMFSPALRQSVVNDLGSDIREARLVAKDEFTTTYDVGLADARQVLLRVPTFNTTAPIVDSEVATLKYLAERTSIPVSSVLAYNAGSGNDTSTPSYAVLQKPPGVLLESVFYTMAPFEQNTVIAAFARWMCELYQHRFESLGALEPDEGSQFRIGPVNMKPFYADGRSKLSLDRGPFSTARAFYRACAQRELDSSRTLFAQDAPPSYQQELEDNLLMVERIAGLMCDLTNRCQGLDEDDPDMAPFSLDIHEIGPKNIYVSPENPSNILCISDWQFVNTRPLWCCARLPSWMRPSLTGPNVNVGHQIAVFKAEVVRVAGIHSPFLRALDQEDSTRLTLDDLSTYDAFRDGFLLLPALENILATLPGHEDVDGLTALLDPSTLPGRVARINLLTRGSNAMYLAMTPPRSPLVPTVKEEGTEKVMHADSPVLVL